jgi:hypothetical protein
MQNGIELPKRIFFTGAPGSRWSGIAQTIENLNGFNTSDRNDNRVHYRKGIGRGGNIGKMHGHNGSYFGHEMEFEAILDADYLDQAWSNLSGTRIIKSHEWAYKIEEIKNKFPDDWIMLVYRPDMVSYSWWHELGGFKISYPKYTWYKDSPTMLGEIIKINSHILESAYKYNLTWNYLTEDWIQDNFGQTTEIITKSSDVLVTILK